LTQPDPSVPDVAALAELDAGLPDDAAAAAARRRAAAADPRAAEVLDALAATRAELAAVDEPELPPAVAARWTAALAAEPATPQRSARRPLRRRVLLVAAAAAVAGVVQVVVPPPTASPHTGSRVDLVAVATSAVGTMDVGALADPAHLQACLRAVLPGAVDEPLLGGRRVVLDGRPGILLVLATGTRGGLHVVTVDPGCGTLLAQATVG
jgi:hypothetical protein